MELAYSNLGLRNNIYQICKAYENVRDKNKLSVIKNSNNEIIIEDYYKAYYKVDKAGITGNIPVLEAQVAFLRNLLGLPIGIAIILFWLMAFNLIENNNCLNDCLSNNLVLFLFCSLVILWIIIFLLYIRNKTRYMN